MTRIGIIGTDAMAHLHIGGLLTSSHFEIAGCYAPDNRQSMIFARQYRLISYSSPEALFKYADAIDIAGDLPETIGLAEKALKAMKHVFIDQSTQLGLEQMKYLKKIADESGVVLFLGTGYRYCPAYDSLIELSQMAKLVDIRHQLIGSNNLMSRLYTELSHDLDFVAGILNNCICKIDVKSWAKAEGQPDLLNCWLECDNGCSINLVLLTVSEGIPKLEITFTSSETMIHADVFNSVIEKQYRAFNVTDSIILDAYTDKAIHKQYMKNFYRATCNEPDAIRQVDMQYQSIAVADFIVEHIRQLQLVASL